MLIVFATQAQFDLAFAVARQCNALAAAQPSEPLTLDVATPEVAHLLEPVADGAVTILPLWSDTCDRWLLVAGSRHAAERAYAHAAGFVVPTLGSLPGNAPFAHYVRCSAVVEPLPLAPVYDGYIEWHTPPWQRAVVLQRWALWVQLEARRPALAQVRTPTYNRLLAAFQTALSAENWADAEDTLGEMQRLHLCTFDNLQFLRFDLLARRGDWQQIWSDAAYPVLAGRPVPRTVRAAMLTAFHRCELLGAEQAGDVVSALATLRAAQPRLGALLTSRAALDDSSVLRVFAYLAAIAADRAALQEISDAAAPGDDATRQVVAMLTGSLPPSVETRPPSARERLRLSLRNRNYDEAIVAAQDLEDAADRTLELLRLARRFPGAVTPAIDAYSALADAERLRLEEDEPDLDDLLNRVLALGPTPQPAIDTWAEWFAQFQADPTATLLDTALDAFRQSGNDRTWTPEALRAAQGQLESLLSEHDTLLAMPRAKAAIAALADEVLDRQFPRAEPAYLSLYDALLDCLVLAHGSSENEGRKLLRLIDNALSRTPSKVHAYANDLRGWFDHPSVALEALLLDAFEMLLYYGAQRQMIFDLFRQWLGSLLDLPPGTDWKRTSRQVWLMLGEWLQPGEDLLGQLRRQLATPSAAATRDPLAGLPAGIHIALFTLNEAAARRTVEILERRSQARVQPCFDTVLTQSASQLATNADIVVITATCLTHALFNGIQPYLQRAPVYPRFHGTTSIVRAIEEYAAHKYGG